MAKKLAPIKAKGEATLELNRDNVTIGSDFWILTDGYRVTVAHQVIGESPKEIATIPKDVFDRMVRWYVRPQKLRRSKP